MGILLVYDVTDEASFNNIRNWMRNIEQHASDNVNKVCYACNGINVSKQWQVQCLPAVDVCPSRHGVHVPWRYACYQQQHVGL